MIKLNTILVFTLILTFSFYLVVRGEIIRVEGNDSSKITCGQIVQSNVWPYSVAIMQKLPSNRKKLICGGSLISDQWVLTAAHCKVRLNDIVIIGRNNLNSSGGEEHEIEKIEPIVDLTTKQKLYNRFTKEYDVALIKLKTKSIQKTIDLVPINGSNNSIGKTAKIAEVIGWGDTSYGGDFSPLLRQASIDIERNDTKCNRAYQEAGSNYQIKGETMICARDNDCARIAQKCKSDCRNDATCTNDCIIGKSLCCKDSCQGDSGGPLMIQVSPTEWQQLGIVGWGKKCALPGVYGVYTEILNPKIYAWINSVVWNKTVVINN